MLFYTTKRGEMPRLGFNAQGRAGWLTAVVLGGSLMTVCPWPGYAQELTPLERVQAIGLDSARVGRVTVYFAPNTRERALELARLAEAAGGFGERELGVSFDFRVATLEPEHWFSEFPGVPYAIPWVSMPERLLFVQSSLTEGFMVRGPTPQHDRYRIDKGLLHEHGHLLEKAYFRPATTDKIPVPWFAELIPNFIAYAYLRSSEPQWAEAAKEMWKDVVAGYTPSKLTLDWSFMNDLPPQELARTYAWYQNLLNLRAAALYEAHGIALLGLLKERLDWGTVASWKSPSLLKELDAIAPGFEAWATDLTNPAYLPRVTSEPPAEGLVLSSGQ